MRQPKYKFILHWFFTPRDRSGNVYSYFSIVDTRSGRIIQGRDVPESNLREAIYEINGREHKQNYYFAQTEIPKRQYDYNTRNIQYIGCDPETLAMVFYKAMNTRKRSA